MSDLLDNEIQIFALTRDWRVAAMCNGADVDMVPGPEGDHATRGEEVMAAKATCKNCLVKSVCLKESTGQPGIWAGLTLDERDRITEGGQAIVACANCGMDCVPLDPEAPECDSCFVEEGKPRSPELFKNNIIAMIKSGARYGEIAEKYSLSKNAVAKACNRWGHRSFPGPRPDPDLAPCGTPAAVRRHQRHGEEMKHCACARPGAWNPNKTKSNGWAAA